MLPLLVATALAGPLNPWGSATAPGTALVEQYLYVMPDGLNPITYGSVGLSSHVDMYLGFGAFIPKVGPSVASLEVYPRFFVHPSLALVPHVFWTPGEDGSVTFAPEVHANYASKRFALVVNAGWRPVLSKDGFSAGTIPVIVAPEVRLNEWFSFYVEVDPTFSLIGDPVGMLVVPGVGATLDPEGHQTVSFGVQVPVLPEFSPASFGAWYCFTFPTKREG